ncbi:hypothetical protein N0V82_005209 [Gnomoniopsis sp. IMI 355080]|nr:hypothetical protein N0V82_005209 [Gnomoniopsis sp. IMI 355080]
MSLQPEFSSLPAAETAAIPPPRPPPPPAQQSETRPSTNQSAAAPAQPEATAMEPKPDIQPHFSWTDPHPQFVVVLVGPHEKPFGIQKDFLCARSSYYRKHFASQADDAVEAIVRLPDTPEEVFGLAQHFMYTGVVFPDDASMPSYEVLVGTWKLGHELGISGLCDRTLATMMEVRRNSERIPGAPLLMQVWRDTPEGSSIRQLLLGWAAEYMRSSESNAEFAKSLPQEVLSELVLAMSRPDTTPVVQLGGDDTAPTATPTTAQSRRKMVHYIDEEEEEEEELEPSYLPTKKQRRSDPFLNGSASKQVAKKSKPAVIPKPVARRRSNPTANGETQEFTSEQKLLFCQDLLARMLSGPGFWTRLVGPFRDPVDPVRDNVPDYFEKVTKPMDLTTMKGKMDRNEYASHEEFFADMTQIFTNCKTYWKPTDTVFAACDKLEKTFLDKYSGMNKWLAKLDGNEEH